MTKKVLTCSGAWGTGKSGRRVDRLFVQSSLLVQWFPSVRHILQVTQPPYTPRLMRHFLFRRIKLAPRRRWYCDVETVMKNATMPARVNNFWKGTSFIKCSVFCWGAGCVVWFHKDTTTKGIVTYYPKKIKAFMSPYWIHFNNTKSKLTLLQSLAVISIIKVTVGT